MGEGHLPGTDKYKSTLFAFTCRGGNADVRVSMIVNNKEVNVADVRLAVNRVDYFVPLDLSAYAGKTYC